MKIWTDTPRTYLTLSAASHKPYDPHGRLKQIAKEIAFVILFLGLLLAGSITDVRASVPPRYDRPVTACSYREFGISPRTHRPVIARVCRTFGA